MKQNYIYKIFTKKMKSKHFREVFFYGVVGLTSLITQDIFYILAMKAQPSCAEVYCFISNHFAMIAMFLGNLIGMTISYIGHNKFTFKREKKCYKEFIKFAITSAIGLAFNLVSTYLLINILHLNHNYGLLPTFIAPAITYTISKFWVFK